MQRRSNPWPHESHRLLDILKWKARIGPRELSEMPEAGNRPAPWRKVNKEQIQTPPAEGWRILWLGHASFLIQGCGLSILIDPIFSDHCAPFPIPSLRRKVPPPLAVGELPLIDAVLLSHSHFDHLDLPTLKALTGNPRIYVPEGHASWLAAKVSCPVLELPWDGTTGLGDAVSVTATPAQHFTARSLFDRNKGHWCGWLLEGGGCKIWHCGDSGYCPAFHAIGERHGPIDFAMIPIGAYQPRNIMKAMHMNPEEAVRTFEDVRCHRAVAMHWGTFQLTDEPLEEPPLRLQRELLRKRISPESFVTGAVGQLWEILPGAS